MSSISDLPASYSGQWLQDSTDESIDENGVQATCSWYGPWAERIEFLRVVSGLPEQITYPGGVSVTRIVPLKYPFYENVYAYNARARGTGSCSLGGDGLTATYDWAIITVNFKTYPYKLDGDQAMITRQDDGGMEFVTRPGSAYIFPSDSLRINQDVGVPVPTNDFSLTFHRLPFLDRALWQTLQGRVNTVDFLGYPAGTIQYVGPSSTATVTIANQFSFEATHRFRFRWIPHNQIMRPDGTGFEAPEDGNGDTILPTTDLNAIFA